MAPPRGDGAEEERRNRGDEAVGATQEELDAARKLYLAGFAFLPWLWFLLAANFWNKSKTDARLAYYVNHSVVGFAISTALLAAWIAWFQTSWQTWGEIGTNMLVVPYTTTPPSSVW